MRRPALVHFLAIENPYSLCIKASVTLINQSDPTDSFFDRDLKSFGPSSPWDSFSLMGSHEFSLKIVALNEHQKPVYQEQFDSDPFGNFYLVLPKKRFSGEVKNLQIYETGYRPGVDLLLGTFLPLKLERPSKIIISDFDKTLVDTRYSTTKEIYQSITKPVDYFPKIQPSIDLLKKYIQEGFQPFILTASPHFYEKAIRDWLYQNQIYTAGIFLKDYRKVFSFTEGDLYPKDLKAQGFYKLNHLIDILKMTGIPDELVLMGDGFESDPLIYLLLKSILKDSLEPWEIWNDFRKQDAFQLTRKQNSTFLSKLYSFDKVMKNYPEQDTKIQIYIRKKDLSSPVKLPEAMAKNNQIDFYEA